MIAFVNHVAGADRTVFHLVNGVWTSPVFDRMMPASSRVGDHGAIWLVLLGLMAAFGGRTGRRMALAGLVAFAMGFFFSGSIKELTMRPRPFLVLVDARLLVPKPGSFALPSGHTTSAFAVASAVLFCARRLLGRVPLWGWGMLALAATISYSRIYVGVHWPTDVAAGALLGALSGWFGARLATRREVFTPEGTSGAPAQVEYAALRGEEG